MSRLTRTGRAYTYVCVLSTRIGGRWLDWGFDSVVAGTAQEARREFLARASEYERRELGRGTLRLRVSRAQRVRKGDS